MTVLNLFEAELRQRLARASAELTAAERRGDELAADLARDEIADLRRLAERNDVVLDDPVVVLDDPAASDQRTALAG